MEITSQDQGIKKKNNTHVISPRLSWEAGIFHVFVMMQNAHQLSAVSQSPFLISSLTGFCRAREVCTEVELVGVTWMQIARDVLGYYLGEERGRG
jgi:hypothetical protein